MKYSVIGFQQEKLIKYDLSMNEILILDYIYNAQASTHMEHMIKDGITYTWIYHSKLMEDLPILNIKEDRLKQVIRHLVDLGLIQRVRTTREVFSGSRSYYGITRLCEDMRYCNDRGEKNYTSESVENCTSDNQLTNKKPIQKTISKDIVEPDTKYSNSKSKKNLYQKCMDMIDEYTTNDMLREKLRECFKLFTENNREVGKPLYANQFKGKLNMLSDLATDSATQIKIVEQTLKLGYNGFYELKEDRSRRRTGNVAHDIEHLYNGVNEKADKRCSDGEKF